MDTNVCRPADADNLIFFIIFIAMIALVYISAFDVVSRDVKKGN